MRTKLFITGALSIFLFSCSGNKDEKKETETSKTEEENKTEEEKYEYKYEIEEMDVPGGWMVSITTKDVMIADVGSTLGSSYGQIFPFLSGLKAEMGIPFAIYHNWIGNDKPCTVEAAIPVMDSTIKVTKEMKLGKSYSGKALRVSYFGPYENMEPAYNDIYQYMQEKGLSQNGSSWEVYIGDPGVETDPMKVQTDIYMPVK